MTRLVVKRGDITKEQVDAIVNAANSGLAGGGGVDGAIHRAAGDELVEECRRLRRELGPVPCPTGHAVITKAGNLPCRHVIHTAGPVWSGGRENEPELLRSCYRKCLELAVEHGLCTISFPCISTGVYGYPPAKAALEAIAAVREFVLENRALDEVRFVVFSDNDLAIYQELLD
jgi:O-acetyl-ADP-ribose deacetylase